MKITYSSNNSGGDWWLDDDDWRALESAGWSVEWFADKEDDLGGIRRLEGGRWLDALASEASVEAESLAGAIRLWEAATKKDATAEGCECCGPPHSFHGGGEYASGADVAFVLAGRDSVSVRDLLEV